MVRHLGNGILLSSAPIAVVVAYFWAFGDSVWHPTDYEHLLAFAWRIWNGEVPYRDFIYHKPPLTIYLHTFWLVFPDGWQIRSSRLCFYLQMAMSGLLPVVWAYVGGKVQFGWRQTFLGAAFLLIALHTFPVMPWYTSDGILFDVIGLVAFVESIRPGQARTGLWSRALASTALTLAVLCKQSFFAPCVLFAAYALGEFVQGLRQGGERGSPAFRRRWSMLACSILPASGLLAALVGSLVATGAWEDFLHQLLGQSTGQSLFLHGFVSYAESPYLPVAVAGFLVPLLRLLDRRRGTGVFWLIRLAVWCVFAAMSAIVFRFAAARFGPLGFVFFFLQAGLFLGWLVGEIIATRKLSVDREMLFLHLGLLSIAWSSGISLGYWTPILGMAGFALLWTQALPNEESLLGDVVPAAFFAGVCAFSFGSANYEFPYRDQPRAHATEDLGQVFPKLAGIRTHREQVDAYFELRALIEEHAIRKDRPFVVLQDYPGIHYLTGQKNPIAIDWAWPPDIAGHERRLWGELERSGAVAIVPKQANAGVGWSREEAGRIPCEEWRFAGFNALSRAVLRSWRLIGQGPRFCVLSR